MFILFYSQAIQSFHYVTEYNILWSHEKVVRDVKEMIEGHVNSFVTWHYTVAEEHVKNNTEELKWSELDDLQAYL